MGKCKDCKWWDAKNAYTVKQTAQRRTPGNIVSECRKYAPRTIVAGCGTGETPEYASDWGIVGMADWCGEFEDKE